jgi:RES domain-containing protein
MLGDDWLRSERTALLRVPSVIVPATWNVLVNPNHAESRGIRIVRTHEQRVDARLV